MTIRNRFDSLSRRNVKPSLNIVALLDIFTVLVFFLLFNVKSQQFIEATTVQDLPSTTIAQDILKDRQDVHTAEFLSENIIVLDKGRLTLSAKANKDENLNAVIDYCKRSEVDCARLAILANQSERYTSVDRFVGVAEKAGFKNIFLVMRKEE
ncbi:ExbD/TolR family protein [Vibrio mimicus]